LGGTRQPVVNERQPPSTSPVQKNPGAFSFLREGL